MSNQDLIDQIENIIREGVYAKDSESEVSVQRTSLGWIDLRIVSRYFVSLDQLDRELYVDMLLNPLSINLGSYPIRRYEILTPDEVDISPKMKQIEMPLWSDILLAPEPQVVNESSDIDVRKPLFVTFYSFKGGVGRTTALGFAAKGLVAEGLRVVAIDFDLEAPGLSFLFPSGVGGEMGLLDYLYQRYLTPEDNIPDIRDCIQLVNINAPGELFIVPAGEYDENYIHKLADLDVSVFYRRGRNPLHDLFSDIISAIDPDVILIDARTGFNAMSAVALFDRSDLAMICFSATDQSFAGLELIAKAVQRHRSYKGSPELRFVITPVPSTQALAEWTTRTYDWIGNHNIISEEFTVSEVCYPIPYSQSIPTIQTMLNDVELSLAAPYQSIVKSIQSFIPESILKSDDVEVENEKDILNQLQFQASTAQELKADTITLIFQRTNDFPKFLSDRTWLVLGAKGTGKTLLFRLFVDNSGVARQIARDELQSGRLNSIYKIDKTLFIPGHGRSNEDRPTLLDSTELASFEQLAGMEAWPLFWRSYAVLQICRGLVAAQKDISFLTNKTSDGPLLYSLATDPHPSRRSILTWLIDRTKDPLMAAQVNDELYTIDRYLINEDMPVWLLYDELDAGFAPDNERRLRALNALCAWWIERGPSMRAIIPKILLREDIWKALDFVNKAHYASQQIQLRWQEDDLWRLVLRQILSVSKTLASQLEERYGVNKERLNNVTIEELRRCLHLLWGQYLGRKGKAYTHNWVRTRISDSNGVSFPRSLIQLLQEAVNQELRSVDPNPYTWLLRPRSLINALDFVSEQRVAEVKNEYPEFTIYLDLLDGERSPIHRSRLVEIWSADGKPISDTQITDIIIRMIEAGILQEYVRTSDNDETRYTVAELYLYGLNMRRYGQR